MAKGEDLTKSFSEGKTRVRTVKVQFFLIGHVLRSDKDKLWGQRENHIKCQGPRMRLSYEAETGLEGQEKSASSLSWIPRMSNPYNPRNDRKMANDDVSIDQCYIEMCVTVP